ncbi:hypothetical protein EON82_03025 [bacterium]|nr:MAG: hypothetical protein EON82_03025 [bacterium]
MVPQDMERRGFATVELLQVIAIIAVLAGVSFPVIEAVRRRAQHTSCAERLHQLGTAITLYANDHDGWVPPATTDEMAYLGTERFSEAEVKASPFALRRALASYVKSEPLWFCPADPQARKDVLWLGQRHRLTSYRFYPISDGQIGAWPPRMQLGRDRLSNSREKDEDVPLVSDSMGIPSRDSDPQFDDDSGRAASCHSDDLVNALRHDLSLSRRPAREWLGTRE